jgi:pimeloyl-ACP methyl ester carboxylesterase
MLRSSPVDGFRLAYERSGSGAPVVLLHGWPGDHADYRHVVPLLSDCADVLAPDLRGFGESDRHPLLPWEGYSAAAQARSIVELIDDLGVRPAVIAGYDIGSRVAQTIARTCPDVVRALVVSPPLPGSGERVLTAEAQREFWYQAFHQLSLVEEIVDGDGPAVRAYLKHFWSHWSGPAFRQPDTDLDRLAQLYGAPGALAASIAWYRAGSGTVATSLRELSEKRPEKISVPTKVLWPEFDPLFPLAWSDALGQFFTDATVNVVSGIGHFVPLEAPYAVAAAVRAIVADG